MPDPIVREPGAAGEALIPSGPWCRTRPYAGSGPLSHLYFGNEGRHSRFLSKQVSVPSSNPTISGNRVASSCLRFADPSGQFEATRYSHTRWILFAQRESDPGGESRTELTL